MTLQSSTFQLKTSVRARNLKRRYTPEHKTIKNKKSEKKISNTGLFELIFSIFVAGPIVSAIILKNSNEITFEIIFVLSIFSILTYYSLSIYGLRYESKSIFAKRLIGKTIKIELHDIEEIKSENLSKPPRSILILRNGRKILFKTPKWLLYQTDSERLRVFMQNLK